MALQMPHNFVIEPLGRQPGWFKPQQYRYYCICCRWMFLVEGRKICALNESGEPLPEPENGQRFASFALGLCVAMPPEFSWRSRGIKARSGHRKATNLLSLSGRLGQSRSFKSSAFPNPKVLYLRSRIQLLRDRPKNLHKSDSSEERLPDCFGQLKRGTLGSATRSASAYVGST